MITFLLPKKRNYDRILDMFKILGIYACELVSESHDFSRINHEFFM